MDRLAGILTLTGTRAGHLAIVSREYRIPGVLQTKIETRASRSGRPGLDARGAEGASDLTLRAAHAAQRNHAGREQAERGRQRYRRRHGAHHLQIDEVGDVTSALG